MRIVLIFFLSALSVCCYSQVQISFSADSASIQNKIYTQQEVDSKPAFPGGDEAIMRSIGHHIKYPVDARRNGISGTVMIGFVVEKDGSISRHAIHQRVWPSLDSEALRVSLLIPNTFTPAVLNGLPVRCRYQWPVQFVLQ